MPDESRDEKGSLSDGRTEGQYANYFQVGHNAFEVLIDFGQAYSDGGQEHFHTRIITSPPYAKELLKILSEALKEYEGRYGELNPASD